MIELHAISLPLGVIRLNGGTQPRVSLNDEYVEELAQALLDGNVLTPVTVFYDGSDYWLADGFHRHHAAKQICKETIDADIKQGTRRDAVLHSVGTNASHGLRRTNADKRRAVETLLNDAEWAKWSDYEIAKRTSTSHELVRQMKLTSNVASEERTYATKHGTIATMNTANIGHTLPASPVPSEHEAELSGYRGYEKWEEKQRELEASKGQEKYTKDDKKQELAKEGRYQLAVDCSTTEYYYDDLRRETIARDEKERTIKSTTLTVLQSSESVEWYTPKPYIVAVRELMGEIDLDPASNELANSIIQASTYYDIETNGLTKHWAGHIYLNPPYGFTDGKSNQEVWSNRLIEQFQSGITTEAVLLVNANTEAKWFQPLYGYLICFTNHRIRFYNADGASSQPTQGNAFVYFGRQSARFIELFRPFGTVLREVNADECQAR